MENKYSQKKKEYNSDKTFVQINKELHKRMKDHCINNNLIIKDFLELIINEKLNATFN